MRAALSTQAASSGSGTSPGKSRDCSQSLRFNFAQNFESSRCLRLPIFLLDDSAAIHSLASFLIIAIPRFLTTTFCDSPESMPRRWQNLSLSAFRSEEHTSELQ